MSDDTDADQLTLAFPDAEQTDAAPRRHRRRWPWVLLVIVVILGLLAVSAELVVRSVFPGAVRGVVIDRLNLPADQQLDVDAQGILLPQLIAGRLDSVHLSTDSITLEGITGAADVTATGVALDGSALAGAAGTVRIDESQFTALLARSELPVDSVSLHEPDATLSGSVIVLGATVPLALTVTPGAIEGDLQLTPVAFEIGGVELDAAQVAARLGALGERLTAPQRICLADRLPAGVTITGLLIDGSDAVIDLDVDGRITSDASLRSPGTCP